ncbi:MAG: hypothetical protein E6R03_16410 [Hyphomicrobiaceae bacterium]|nr:MAG: hypothetical protein E6R03_16410 [Hyphomicrobiaceae bacterium]
MASEQTSRDQEANEDSDASTQTPTVGREWSSPDRRNSLAERLGRPGADVRPLWADKAKARYRINVWADVTVGKKNVGLIESLLTRRLVETFYITTTLVGGEITRVEETAYEATTEKKKSKTRTVAPSTLPLAPVMYRKAG